ncbi:MAG: LysE family translocator [Rhodospirillales bacterium]|jgi:homoserine/homoserine lactone efflux protein|nr:LysE family translocator [Rhodospirillales bacterium]MBT4041618.1 LysE family translocator [Rhodospirillales bacterium]MBT4625327.1 LysE family translocator [Rhodospirillales bacterium]MBT5351900.1 LysE family translocator [Rhodospirillales bacterium]MBT5521578.1 LysE family translocator [Rhodospirillales bacterium]
MSEIVDINLWLTFTAASVVLALIPGPVVSMVIAQSLSHGFRTGLRGIVGVVCGNTILFAIGGLGMAWVLALLADWFDVVRWAGAAYLVYLGARQWFAKPDSIDDQLSHVPSRKAVFWQGFLVAITNPKTIVFYAAFFPQFMDPALPSGGQLVVLSVTFLLVVNGIDLMYAALAGRLRPLLTGEKRGRIRNRITGVLLMGTGIAMALARR